MTGGYQQDGSAAPTAEKRNVLDFVQLFPPFAEVKEQEENVVVHMNELLTRGTKELEALEKDIEAKLEDQSLTYVFVARELESINDRLSRPWSTVTHLKSVCDTLGLRKAVEEVQPKFVEFGLKMGQSKALLKAWEFILDQDKIKTNLTPSQRRIAEKELVDAELSGVGLEGEKKERFAEIQKQLAKLSTDFSNNVLDGTKAFSVRLTEQDQVKGLPESALGLAAQTAKSKGDTEATPEKGPWVLTLDFPSYFPVMQYAEDRDLREKMYKAHVTKASEFSSTEEHRTTKDNAPIVTQILQLRKEKAELLGYKNYAEVSLVKKMATLDKAMELMEDLRKASWEAGKKELQELQEFAEETGFTHGKLMQWDTTFYAEKLKEARYEFNEEELKPYFSFPKVQQGLWSLAERLFDVKVRRLSDVDISDLGISLWHPDVQVFELKKSGNLQSYFYVDPYSRPETKKGGAWMSDVADRTANAKLVVGPNKEVRLPVAHMVCNQPSPVGEKPSLMSFSDVETLFHEFGHSLQHMLTQESEGMAAGINLVDWDAVEQPSQFMENWCYDKPTVDNLAIHFETGEAIPEELFLKLKKAKTYRAASMMLRQLHFSIVDLKLHSEFDPNGSKTVYDFDREVGELTDVMPMQPYDRFLNGFSHIFAGGYAAGYFSYKWAEVLSADCFAAFEEVGLDNEASVKETGLRFRDTVLGMGGGRPPAEVFQLFRGRDPSATALLRHNGLLPEGSTEAR